MKITVEHSSGLRVIDSDHSMVLVRDLRGGDTGSGTTHYADCDFDDAAQFACALCGWIELRRPDLYAAIRQRFISGGFQGGITIVGAPENDPPGQRRVRWGI